jgi:hypothetical protein
VSATIASGLPGTKPKLLQRVRDVTRRKQYSIRTEQLYVDWIKRFILYHNKRHPSEMAEEEVAEFLTHLARDRNVAPATQSQALSALLSRTDFARVLIAKGSLFEVVSQTTVALRRKLLGPDNYNQSYAAAEKHNKMLSGLRRSLSQT